MDKEKKTISLLKKISQKQLLFGFVIVLGSLIILYFLTRAYIIAETEEGLYHTSFRIEQRLFQDHDVFSLFPLFEVHIVDTLRPEMLKDTLIFDALQNEDELFKELNTYKAIYGTNYHIITRALLVESDDTLMSIIITFAVIIILIYLAQYIFNKNLNKTIWTPFFKNLEAVKAFSISSGRHVQLEYSDVSEFSELNAQLEILTSKVATDYQNLKQFTENLSHEVQTPLAIIQAKIENLIDGSKDLDQDQLKTLYDIQTNTKRLSKLNKGLILLTKIDNQQFNTVETLSVNAVVSELLKTLQDISSHKEITVKFSIQSESYIVMDKVLADILFSNIIGNAIKHTNPKGKIDITVSSNSFEISNSAPHKIADPDQLFQRFYKGNRQSNSLGLGLAIVKKICDYYHFNISYTFSNATHRFHLHF